MAVAPPGPDTEFGVVLGDGRMSYDSRRKTLRDPIDGLIRGRCGESPLYSPQKVR